MSADNLPNSPDNRRAAERLVTRAKVQIIICTVGALAFFALMTTMTPVYASTLVFGAIMVMIFLGLAIYIDIKAEPHRQFLKAGEAARDNSGS